jgi:hypothetical protein
VLEPVGAVVSRDQRQPPANWTYASVAATVTERAPCPLPLAITDRAEPVLSESRNQEQAAVPPVVR